MRGHAIANGIYVARGQPRRPRGASSASGLEFWGGVVRLRPVRPHPEEGEPRQGRDPGREVRPQADGRRAAQLAVLPRPAHRRVRRASRNAWRTDQGERLGVSRPSLRQVRRLAQLYAGRLAISLAQERLMALPIPLRARRCFALRACVRRRLEAGPGPAHDQVGQEGHARRTRGRSTRGRRWSARTG